MRIAEMFLAGAGLLIGIYLVASNPQADQVLIGSGSTGGIGIIRALQGR